jgi:Xaa-Pro aminopeptidase
MGGRYTDIWLGVKGDIEANQSIMTILKDVAGRMKLKSIGYEDIFEFAAPPHLSGEPLFPSEITIQMYRDAFPVVQWLDATNLLYQKRTRKTSYELKKLKRANEIAAYGLKAFFNGLIPGKTEAELSAEVEATI